MKKNTLFIGLLASMLTIGLALFGCGQQESATTTTASTTTTTTTAAGTTTSTTGTTTSTAISSSLSGQVKVPAAAIAGLGLASSNIGIFASEDGVSNTALAGATILAVDAGGNIIAGTNMTTSDASGNFTVTNVPTNTAFYIKATKEVGGEIVVVKDITSMESSTVTGEALNAKTSLVAQRIANILANTSLTSFEAIHDINPKDVADLLNYQVGMLTDAPDLKSATENEVLTNLDTTYNSLTSESITLEAIDSSANAQLLVGAAATEDEYKAAAWKFFNACGFGVPTIESLSLSGHDGLNSAMPSVPETVIDTVVDYLQQNYRWNMSGILASLNSIASWEVHYTVGSDESSAASAESLVPATLSANGGTITHPGLNDLETYNVITANCPTIEEGAFANLLYGTIPSYEGYVAQIRGLERPDSPSWETQSLIAVATLAFPASFWDTTPGDASDDETFSASTQLNILQAYSLIYYRQLKIESFSAAQEPPYYNHQIRIQLSSRPSLEAELLEHFYDNKI